MPIDYNTEAPAALSFIFYPEHSLLRPHLLPIIGCLSTHLTSFPSLNKGPREIRWKIDGPPATIRQLAIPIIGERYGISGSYKLFSKATERAQQYQHHQHVCVYFVCLDVHTYRLPL
ncbi:Hypothetical predicted protein [Pelobates cultripes]|uniref:Uncharacterized protein n=1 Tax=Pelobates cultripes TaxID=61616 RepID=A0AAD1W190_PELCU|nr:Hypothetical predicted protein [Pelobates cultripes]